MRRNWKGSGNDWLELLVLLKIILDEGIPSVLPRLQAGNS